MTDEELAALKERHAALLVEITRLEGEMIVVNGQIVAEEDRRARGNVRDFRPRPAGHAFVRPGQVSADLPAPDACVRCGRPEAGHGDGGE
jgi:hypothetical protein